MKCEANIYSFLLSVFVLFPCFGMTDRFSTHRRRPFDWFLLK